MPLATVDVFVSFLLINTFEFNLIVCKWTSKTMIMMTFRLNYIVFFLIYAKFQCLHKNWYYKKNKRIRKHPTSFAILKLSRKHYFMLFISNCHVCVSENHLNFDLFKSIYVNLWIILFYHYFFLVQDLFLSFSLFVVFSCAPNEVIDCTLSTKRIHLNAVNIIIVSITQFPYTFPILFLDFVVILFQWVFLESR